MPDAPTGRLADTSVPIHPPIAARWSPRAFDPTNGEIVDFAVFSDTLYASTWSFTETHGAEIWRSSSGDSTEWTRVVADGLGDSDNEGVVNLEMFGSYLYAGVVNGDTGCEVWRTSDGATWNRGGKPAYTRRCSKDSQTPGSKGKHTPTGQSGRV